MSYFISTCSYLQLSYEKSYISMQHVLPLELQQWIEKLLMNIFKLMTKQGIWRHLREPWSTKKQLIS